MSIEISQMRGNVKMRNRVNILMPVVAAVEF